MGWRAPFIALITALLCAAPASAATLTVTTSDDPGGSCTGTTCTTLRAALTEAARLAGTDTIVVPAGVISISNDFVINQQVQIIGASARTTIIDANAKSRAFRVTGEGTLQLANVTVRNGVSGGGDELDGGGIYNAGNMQLVNVRVTGNATQTGGRGGGIANDLGYLVADNLLVDNNVSDNGAGGIHNTGGQEIPNLDGWLILTDSTIFKNTSGLGGVGGIQSTGTGAAVSLSRSTVADNTAGARGIGGLVPSGNSQVVGSLLARNLVLGETVNCGSAKPTDAHFNVEDDTDCALAPGGMKPGLATTLSNQGGQLDVLTITQGGDAFNRMPLGDTPCEGTDQRGTARPQSAACDAGAFELVVPPFVTITSGPNGTVTGSQVEFNFQADRSGVTVQCDLTGPGQTAGYETCYKENAQPYTGLADGPYTFSVRAVNTQYPDAPATTRTFVVNTAAPNTTITAGPTGPINDATPTFSFISSEPGSTFECAIDSTAANAWGACSSPHTTATLTQGAHTIFVRAIDAAGSVDATPASRAFTVDTVPPNTTITGGPTGLTASTSATFTYSSEAGAMFQCALDGAAFAACPASYTGLAQGAHTIQVRAVDTAGNVDASPASRSWTVDTVGPDTTIGSGPTGRTASTSATFTFTSNDAGATFQCALDGAAFAACPVSYTGLSQGAHTFQVRAVDAAGNVDASPASRNWTVDTTAPNAPTIENAAAGGSTVTLSGKSEAGATVEILEGAAVVGSATADSSANWTLALANVPDGPHTYTARARDAAGNLSGVSAPRAVTVDTAPPPAPEVQGPSGATTDRNPAFTFAAAEPTVECRLDGPAGAGSYAACVSPKSFSALAPGEYVFFVRVTDPSGLQTETRRPFTVTQPQPAQTPTPTPTPTPRPTPVPNQTIVVTPARTGTVLVKEKGASKFEPLDVTKGIKNGSEVDVRNGRVTLTSIPKAGAPPETADFYGGMFIVTQKGGITDLKLSERLTGCPKGQQASLSLAQKKPKSRKLWGNGKGSFRTTGKYSAATVRGTIWLVQDSCTTTLTRVTAGVVQVNDFVKKKKFLVKKGKRYTAKAKKR